MRRKRRSTRSRSSAYGRAYPDSTGGGSTGTSKPGHPMGRGNGLLRERLGPSREGILRRVIDAGGVVRSWDAYPDEDNSRSLTGPRDGGARRFPARSLFEKPWWRSTLDVARERRISHSPALKAGLGDVRDRIIPDVAQLNRQSSVLG